MVNRFSEKDWKLFRKKLLEWQEAYMDKLNKEYIEPLSAEGNASDKFWHWRNESVRIRKLAVYSVK
ncbi:hypothetical protein [Ruminococcus gauvreauii]|uniref:hypothetical protein n=1 Tax=Ruminococcus gauvreauii TaxID=438033 RepID=UPI0004139F2C